jgi:hypothetical protein
MALPADAVTRLDWFRRSPFAVGGPGGHKEWHHFCVLGPGVDLLVNFSFCDDVRSTARRGAELARLTVLVRSADGGWDGDVVGFPAGAVRVAGGGIDVALGPNRLRFVDGAYEISVVLPACRLAAELRLEPRTVPAFAPNIPLPDGPPLHWVLMPRLHASGHIVRGDDAVVFDDGLAYHDHNWGHFLWGHRFSWIWGFALPDDRACPWSVAFVRLMDRARTAVLAQGLFLWRGAEQHRVFRDGDVALACDVRCLRGRPLLKVPRVMALLAPDALCDVPRRVEMSAAADGDALAWRFDAADGVQVVLPSDTDLSVTIINEVAGAFHLEGRVGGETVAMDGRAICEFLGA